MNKIGIIAGEGKMPVYIAREAKKRGLGVIVGGLKGISKEEDFAGIADAYGPFGLGQVGGGIKFFKKHGVDSILMAGRVRHTVVFSSLLPDLRTAKALASLPDFSTQSLLGGVIKEFEKDGIKFISSATFLENFIPKKGLLTKRAPSKDQQASIDYGIKIAKAIAGADIGLTAVLAGKSVVALEGMEGTDECIKRAGELYAKTEKNKGPLVIVKAARPNQDFRMDLPVIGKGTIESMITAGADTIAIESEKTLIIDIDEVIDLANKNKLIITAF
ncbi:hypothetical protein Dip518_000783 [Parelusimicrobium proximum]|uniref:LpxI family protein n=1 Tax=Parelusimicrobium proximum TaxID=3228953 RepID=UPI003D17F607